MIRLIGAGLVTIAAVGCSTGPVAIAPNREQARVIEPEARAFIDSFRAATWKVTEFSCRVEQAASDGKSTVRSAGRVALGLERVSTGAAMVKKYRIEQDSPRVVWAFDGQTAAKADFAKGEYQSMDTPSGDSIPAATPGALVPAWVLRDLMLTPTAQLVAARMLPDEAFEGTPCRVVEYTVELPMVSPLGADAKGADDPGKLVLRQVRHIGSGDLLTRKLESWTRYTANATRRDFVGVYRDLRVSGAAGGFALAKPEGFRTIETDPVELGFPGFGSAKLKFAKGDAAPPFKLKDPDGKEVTLASLKGRVVLLDFWATWCGPCKLAMPRVQALHERYAGKPVSVYGVDTWEKGPAGIAKKYMDQQKYTYGLLLGGDDLAKAYGVPGIPALVLIGPDGKVLFTSVGFTEEAEKRLPELIEGALAGK